MPVICASGKRLASNRDVPPMPQPQSRMRVGFSGHPDHLSISYTKSFLASTKSFFLYPAARSCEPASGASAGAAHSDPANSLTGPSELEPSNHV